MSFAKSADDIKNFANRLKPIMELGAFLEKIGSLENAAQEATVKHQKAVLDHAEAIAKLGDVTQKVLCSEELVVAHKSKAEALVKQAEQKGAAIVAAADRKAAEVLNLLQSKKASVDAEIQAAVKDLVSVHQEIEEKKSELEAVKKEAVEFKIKLAALVK